jgi:ribosomal protein S18 acetylase RimI-like enzyme
VSQAQDETADHATSVTVTEAHSATSELLLAINALLPQLSSTASSLTLDSLRAMIESDGSILLVATDGGGKVVGSLTLGIFRVPTGVRAWIEDVVVDNSARGQGVGSALVLSAIGRSQELGARTVDLTSRPSRVEANRLYQRLGFEARETNVYRWKSEG